MGLEGTLKAFSLGDIFQVLGMQRKSGVLSVESADDAITISFLGGQIVSAESRQRRHDNQIGKLLLRAGRLSESDLARALELQKETRQRLGFLLIRERMVTPEDLKEALRLQIFRTLQIAFQLTDGSFRFSQEGQIEYDADHMAPVPTESVLMEAAQIHDELPRLKEKIRSVEIVYRRAPGKETLQLVPGEGAALPEGAAGGSRAEREVWQWIDGKRPVAQILETAFLSDFEVLKGLSDLLDRKLIVEGRVPEAVPEQILEPAAAEPAPALEAVERPSGLSLGAIGLWAAVLALGVVAVWRVPRNPWNSLWQPSVESSPFAVFFKSVSLDRLSALERAVRVFYDATGRYPRELEELTANGILDERAVSDPWGRQYRYILRPDRGKFGLYGRDARGQIDLDLSFDRTLAPVAEVRPGQSAPKPPQAQPSVQVVE
ncbi:MAG TPA: DUF4388 domain-containing protein [Thermoanaerobaculia bacterium]